MPRKGPVDRRELVPDPVYRSSVVTQVVNKVLRSGKRSTAERIVYSALQTVESKTGSDKGEEETMTFDAATLIWRGREKLQVADLVDEVAEAVHETHGFTAIGQRSSGRCRCG